MPTNMPRLSSSLATDATGATRWFRLHLSRAAKADGDATVLDDNRHLAAAGRHRKHVLQSRRVFLDVDISKRNVPLFVILTGGCGVGSGVFPVDDHFHIRRLR